VLRDNKGRILVLAWDTIDHCQSAEMGEAIACLQGLKIAIANSNSNMIIKIECAAVVDCFKQTSCNRSEVSVSDREGIQFTEASGSTSYYLKNSEIL
jgi:hypothetical protein